MTGSWNAIATGGVDLLADTGSVNVRRGTVDDVAAIARHRASMFVEIGSAAPDLAADLEFRTRTYLQEAMPRGEYVAWLAYLEREATTIVAGAGVQMRRKLPFPRGRVDGTAEIGSGREAIVLNVYTEPGYRRRGVARRLMFEILAWAKSVDLESLVLHAAPDGRRLYESLGFAATNEMRFAGDLSNWQPGGDGSR